MSGIAGDVGCRPLKFWILEVFLHRCLGLVSKSWALNSRFDCRKNEKYMESQSKMLYFEGPKNLGRNDKPRLQGKKKMSTGRSHWQPPRSRDRWCLVDETDETTRCEWRRDRNSFEFQESIISSTYTKYHQIQHLPSCIYQIKRYQN